MRVNTTVSFSNCDANAAALFHLLRGGYLLFSGSGPGQLGRIVPPDRLVFGHRGEKGAGAGKARPYVDPSVEHDHM